MKYSKEITKEICGHVENGNTQKDAAQLSGICEDTFYEWMKKTEFSESIKKAESICKNNMIKIIQKEAKQTWQAAAWWLERRYKNEYSLKQELEHSGNVSFDVGYEESED